MTAPTDCNAGRFTAVCRQDCGACCIALSVSSPIPGMPEGKPAGVRCLQLTEDNRCRLFGQSGRPAVCTALKPSSEMCGGSFDEAMSYLALLEERTTPGGTEGDAGGGFESMFADDANPYVIASAWLGSGFVFRMGLRFYP